MNNVVKYRYLFPKNLSDGDALQTAVSAAIVDYNDHRPHGSLYGLTPTEAYDGLDKSTLLTFEKLKEAQKARIEHNKKSRCQKCKD